MKKYRKEIESLIDEGYITKREMEDGLSIYKYTPQTVFENKWNKITLRCRGLVLNEQYEIIADCIPKFFNIEEFSYKDIPKVKMTDEFIVYEKYDGSLIQIFSYNGKIYYTSSGGYNNDYTEKAKEIMEKWYPKQLEIIKETDRVNFVFELIAPLTRVVVNYYNRVNMVLLAVRNRDGREFDLSVFRRQGFNCANEVKFKTIDDVIKKKKEDYHNLEGYVVKFMNNERIKFKYDDYFLLHATVSHLSKQFTWKYLSAGERIPLENMPDEYYEQINTWKEELEFEFKSRESLFKDTFNSIPDDILKNRKEFATHVLRHHKEISGGLFMLYDNKDIDKLIWREIKSTIK